MDVDPRDVKGGLSASDTGADGSSGSGIVGELKIKGQAELERKRSRVENGNKEQVCFIASLFPFSNESCGRIDQNLRKERMS